MAIPGLLTTLYFRNQWAFPNTEEFNKSLMADIMATSQKKETIQIPRSRMLDATHDGHWYGHISKAYEAAVAAGKEFLLWNDRIYVVGIKDCWDVRLDAVPAPLENEATKTE